MKKRILATILALAMTLSFVGCGSGQDTAATDSQETETTEEETVETEAEEGETTAAEPLRIGVSLPNQTNVFFLQIVDGIESAITGENDEVIITDANGDQNKQLNDVTDMINQGCNVIALSPINSDGVRATLEYCQDAGVPVIAFNVGVADNLKSMVETTIVSDNEVAGHLCAQALAEGELFNIKVGELDSKYNNASSRSLQAGRVLQYNIDTQLGDIDAMPNCYMLKPGETVEIPVTKAYEVWKQESYLGPETLTGEPQAEFLWMDEEGLVTSMELVSDPDDKTKSRIKVTTASGKEGNALVGVRIDGEMRWAWHIWLRGRGLYMRRTTPTGTIRRMLRLRR